MSKHTTLHGNCLDHMRDMEAESVHSIITDPPYGLKFMGKDWDHGVPGPHFWQEALRVAKPGSHLLAFGGTRTHHRLVCAIEDAGWEIRDMLMWLYGSGFPKSHNLHGAHEGWGTALKPAWEPIIMARKPIYGTVVQNMDQHGVGAINVNESRIPTSDNLNGGAYSETRQPSTSDWAKTGSLHHSTGERYEQPPGRWPANLIHDGSEEVASMFPQASGQQYRTTGEEVRKDANVYGKYAGVIAMEPRDKGGSAARFFYVPKASKSDRDEGVPDGNRHPCVKPTELMRYLCRMVTPAGGVIYDPFMGSGSTGKAALLDGFEFIGSDLDVNHVEVARGRCAFAVAASMDFQPTLFG